jgi:flagellar protein FlaF
MNAQLLQDRYARPDPVTRSPRAAEYDLLARTTSRLQGAWARRADDHATLVGALADNLSVWSTLAADVAGPANGLPPALRARLFYLYEFTAHHSRAVLENRAGIEVLVDINTAVMRGLRNDAGPGA